MHEAPGFIVVQHLGITSWGDARVTEESEVLVAPKPVGTNLSAVIVDAQCQVLHVFLSVIEGYLLKKERSCVQGTRSRQT
jgi:hypothetical protein